MVEHPNKQLQTLAIVNQSLRQLIDNLVHTDASPDALAVLNQQILALSENFSKKPAKRPIPHFNNHLASSQPNLALPYSPICGPFNPVAPPVDLSFDKEKQQLIGRLCAQRVYEGPQGLLHGGIISAIYDQILAMLSTCLDRPSFTAYLTIQYCKPTPLFEDLVFTAWVDAIEGRKAFIKGHCTLHGDILTEAEGLFIHVQ